MENRKGRTSRDEEAALLKVIIADDDQIMRKILDTSLSAEGYDLSYAEDGSQAWKMLMREQLPSIIIVDWMMPGMDGLELCRKAKRRRDGCLISDKSRGLFRRGWLVFLWSNFKVLSLELVPKALRFGRGDLESDL